MDDLGGVTFVLLFIGFVACTAAGGLATLVGLVLQRRGRPGGASQAVRWAVGLSVAGAVCLAAAGVLFSRLSH